MGERLARASQDSKAAEIQHKLSKVGERWQHLLDLIAARWVQRTNQTPVNIKSVNSLFYSRACLSEDHVAHRK